MLVNLSSPSRSVQFAAWLAKAAYTNVEGNTELSSSDWHDLLLIAHNNEIAGMVHLGLQEKNHSINCPPDFGEYCRLFYELNFWRTKRILATIHEVQEVANVLRTPCVFMKGAALLLQSPDYLKPAWMMADIDVLVFSEQLSSFDQKLRERQYYIRGQIPAWSHHLPPLVSSTLRIVVELHRHVGMQYHMLPSIEAIQSAISSETGELVLSPTHCLIHNFFHSMVQNRFHELGTIPLKSLVQLDWIVRQHGDSLNWTEIFDRVRASRLEQRLRAHLYMAAELFETPFPFKAQWGYRERLHYARCMFQHKTPILQRISRTWLALTPDLSKQALEYRLGRECWSPPAVAAHLIRRAIYHRLRGPSRLRYIWNGTDPSED